MLSDDDLEIVVDEPLPDGLEPAGNRTPTRPLRLGSMEIDFSDDADGRSTAEFLELMAKLIRTRGKIRIILE